MVMRKLNSYTFRFSMSKKGQFFILSAVIMASIIVTLASVQNYVGIGDAPKKFYYYSQQLEDETAAVVDYALYQDPTGDNKVVKDNLNKFLQQSIEKTLAADSTNKMEIFACYTNSSNSTTLICQNNGTQTMVINVSTLSSGRRTLAGSKGPPICETTYVFGSAVITCLSSINSLSIAGKTMLTVTPAGSKGYNIPIQNSAVQRGQFYFTLKINTTSGDYLSTSGGNTPV